MATPNYKVLEHFNDFADAVGPRARRPSTARRSARRLFYVPERPGLGLRLNHEVCAKHPRTGGRIRLFEAGWEQRQG